jgi:Spy/CpxP family protein refolding chaperone
MTKRSKVTFASALSVIALGLTIAGSSFAASQTTKERGDHPQMTAEERAAHETEMKTHLENALNDAVKNSKITEDQKAHILDVMDQIHTKREAGDKEGAKALHDELDKWMTDNKIDRSILPMRKGPHGFPAHHPHGPHPDDHKM